MTGIGSIAILASQAAQPLAAGPAASADAAAPIGPAADSGGGGATPSNLSGDYAMSLLAKITHAGADQALALIQGMLPAPPAR